MKEKFLKLFTNLKQNLLDEIYPKNYSCHCCSEELKVSNDYFLCNKCLASLRYIKHPCKKCSEDLNDFTDYCRNCKDKVRNFDRVISSLVYDGVAKNLVYKFKYSGQKYIADCISVFMLNKIKSSDILNKIDLVLPVPLSEERFKSRGFNQAEILSLKISRELNIEHNSSVLKRVKATPTQTNLNKVERAENLLNAFEVADSSLIKGKTILVIDDIITTGATLDEISKVLKNKGAKSVYGLTFCHTKLENI